jgi:uncharacterized protein YutE (UPF0331/DUF86 family)
MSDTTEQYILENLVPELEADGYEVFLRPGRAARPAFLKDFVPDAIAVRADRKLVIEVARTSPDTSTRLERLNGLLRDRDDWELRLIWISLTSADQPPEIQSIPAMRTRIGEVKELAAQGHRESALLVAWAAFEAIGRALLPTQFRRPQTPGRLVEVLAREGCLTPKEAEISRTLMKKRNDLVHGDLALRVTDDEVNAIATILDSLLLQAEEESNAHA